METIGHDVLGQAIALQIQVIITQMGSNDYAIEALEAVNLCLSSDDLMCSSDQTLVVAKEIQHMITIMEHNSCTMQAICLAMTDQQTIVAQIQDTITRMEANNCAAWANSRAIANIFHAV